MGRGKGKNNKPKPVCIDCGIKVSRVNSRCRICSLKGKNNPNYKHGKTFTKIKCDICGKMIKDRGQKTGCCVHCAKTKYNGFKGKKHSEKTKAIISKKSSEKFTDKYLARVRVVFEERGLWTPKEQLSNYEIYFKKCNWIDRMISYVSKKELKLFLDLGFFNSKNNTKGVVRDHKYSRYSGFLNKVPACILRHPCNCQIITHAKNVSKAHKDNRYKDNDSISLEQLFKQIKRFKGKWEEQRKCLKMINLYKKESGRLKVGGNI